MERSEADELRGFIRSLILNIRMNYGNAMTLVGIDHNLIYEIHHVANQGMVDWLENAD